jgi:hypothetical protein
MKNIADPPIRYSRPDLVPTRLAAHGVSKASFTAYVLFSLITISVLPYFIPSPPSTSDSYLFGYNNRAGILLLLLFVAAGVLWTRGINLRFLPSDAASRPVARETLAFALFGVFCGCVIMFVFAGRYGGFGESFYVIDRVWLLGAGKIPYRDFEFAYGPASLYGPVWINAVLPIGLVNAYYVFWIASYLLGAYLLYRSVNMLNYPTQAKEQIFLLLYFSGIFGIIRMGTNYTFLRFACPIFFVLVIQKLLRKSSVKSNAGAILAAVAFAGILIANSPETAIAFAFATIWICLFQRSEPVIARGAKVAVLAIAYLGLFWAAKRLHVLDTLLADGNGAINFPITVAPHVLLFFFAVFVCTCYLYWRLRDRSLDDNTIGLIGYSIPMIAAALGRCDPSHVVWNGLAIFLASMCYVSNYAKAWRTYRLAFLLFAFLLPNLSELYLFLPQLRAARYLNRFDRNIAARIDVGKIYPSWNGQFLAPFGYRPDGFGTNRSSRVDYGRFEEVIDVSTGHTIGEKINEMREHPEKALILPEDYDRYCQTNPLKESHYLTVLFVFPYLKGPARPVSDRNVLCDYIRDNYRLAQGPSSQSFGYGLWEPKQSN